MLSPAQVPAKVEQITDSSMRGHKSLSLPDRLEAPHTSLSHSGRLMRLLSPIILILLDTVDRRESFSALVRSSVFDFPL